jgi:uncharacterized protein (DUF488 family)
MTKTIWTIGHSTLDLPVFLAMLTSHGITSLVDVRALPDSDQSPNFNQANMKTALTCANIQYNWMSDLGGRRKPVPNSINTAWDNDSFRGYADHMQTPVFKKAFTALTGTAATQPTAIMCLEADWSRCHRALIADALKAKDWNVLHITAGGVKPHPYTRVARVEGGQLSYSQERFL